MKSKLLLQFVLSVGFLAVCGSALAHHGGAAYSDKLVELKQATVTKFLWSSPHSLVNFDVKDDKGNVVRWGAEMNSPGVLARAGWTRHELKAGDQISITLSPSKAGAHLGVVSKIVLPDGRELKRPGGGGGGED